MTTVAALALLTFLATVAWLAWRQRGAHRRCPTCRCDLDVVRRAGEGPNATYDVLACPRCSFTNTLVDGIASGVALCPTCGNRSLEVPTVRVAGLPPSVGVREHCTLCGHERSYTVTAEPEPGGKVIPFPGGRGRKRTEGRSG